MPREYRALTEADREPLARILGLCFGQTSAMGRRWIDRDGAEGARVLTDGGRVAGGLFLLPMGQWFGGRCVPMTGLATVAVDPPYRSAGAATWLVGEAVREMHREGVALSTLFASTQPLYRRVGYEQAGHHFLCRMDTSRMFANDRDLDVRRLEEADLAEVERLHERHGAENPGTLRRSAAMWRRVREGRDPEQEIQAYGFERDGQLEGYLYAWTGGGEARLLRVEDVVVTTPAAARRMLTFFREHRSLIDTVAWRGHPAHPLLLAAREQRHTIKHWDTWMLRIVDVPAALEARGYPPGLEAELHLDVADDVLPENAGRWVLAIEGGRGSVSRGGRGALPLDVRVLAALYTGFVSPAQAAVAFVLDPAIAKSASLAAAFAGPTPWIQDGF